MMNGTDLTVAYPPLLILGAVIGFFGWTLYRVGVPALGAIAGGAAGYAAATFVVAFMKLESSALPIAIGLGIIIGATLGMLLIRALQFYLFFGSGMLLGGAFVKKLWDASIGLSNVIAPTAANQIIVIIIGAVLGGIMMTMLKKFVIIPVTSIVGAMLVGSGLPLNMQIPGSIIALCLFLFTQIKLRKRFFS